MAAPDYDNLEQSLLDYVDNFVYGRTELDVVYEMLLKYGRVIWLTYPVDEFTIAGKESLFYWLWHADDLP